MIDTSFLWITFGNDCNLRCKYCCYKMRSVEMIEIPDYLSFIQRVTHHIESKLHQTPILDICGWGEVFHYDGFVDILNALDKDKYEYINITTNGTNLQAIDKIENIEKLFFTVSVDAPEDFHDKNRGKGNFRKTISFIKKLQRLGVKNISINNIIGRSNCGKVSEIISYFNSELGISKICFNTMLKNIRTTEHIRKDYNPENELLTEADYSDLFLNHSEYFTKEYSLPDRQDLDDHGLYLSLRPDGSVTNCCEGVVKIGNYLEPVEVLFDRLKKSKHCGLCGNC